MRWSWQVGVEHWPLGSHRTPHSHKFLSHHYLTPELHQHSTHIRQTHSPITRPHSSRYFHSIPVVLMRGLRLPGTQFRRRKCMTNLVLAPSRAGFPRQSCVDLNLPLLLVVSPLGWPIMGSPVGSCRARELDPTCASWVTARSCNP